MGDCYTCAVVEHLSKEELSDCDATQNLSQNDSKKFVPEIVVENGKISEKLWNKKWEINF